jgi:WD40 repeat protein
MRINSNNYINEGSRFSKLNPLKSYSAHDNSIFDFEWICNDKKFITASGDMKCKIINTDKGKFINEFTFIGHSKSVKCVKQAFYNDNLFFSCGRDGVILYWDLRVKKSSNLSELFSDENNNNSSIISVI